MNEENEGVLSPLVEIDNLIEAYHLRVAGVANEAVDSFLHELKQIVKKRSSLITKTIGELKGLRFFVDQYQRGYKWTPHEVEALLKDIDEFEQQDESFYCLQPVVVKYHPPTEQESTGRWELIDGQQRITTIFMILTFLESDHYRIEYKTRKTSDKFLKEHLSETLNYDSWDHFWNADDRVELNNVDNYHFYTAYQSIAAWFSTKSKEDRKVWKDKLLQHTKVIWYAAKSTAEAQAMAESESIDIFMRINSGKIPLTNAELIKALFLHYSSDSKNSEAFRLKQIEIARDWDQIEYQLQDDEFWYFLRGREGDANAATRIDFLFDILKDRRPSQKDPLYTFTCYSQSLPGDKNDRPQWVMDQWRLIKECYYRLREWYEDDKLFHLAGFVLTGGLQSARELHNDSTRLSKSEFKASLRNRIGEQLKGYFYRDGKFSLDTLQYREHNGQITNVLYLLNIDAHEAAGTRMSFRLFNSTPWSLEHIHAQNSKPVNESEVDIEALELPEESQNLLKSYIIKPEGNDSSIEKIAGAFNADEMHCPANMALLSKNDNSAIGNQIFLTKRQKVLALDKEGHFIPLATKQVFSKYYSKSVSQMYRWDDADRKGYRAAWMACLRKYMNIQEEGA
jgi:hypothetical protein